MMESKPISIPSAPGSHLAANSGTPLPDPTKYRSLVGALQYLSIIRPDISFAVNQVCKFMQAPTSTHWQAAKRILRYIKGTIEFGLVFTKSSSTNLNILVDAEDDRRSTTGSCVFLGPNPVAWMSKKQPTVSRSSAEAEYRAIAHVAAELKWFCSLLREFGVRLTKAPVIHTNSRSAMFMATNPVIQAKTRHIEIDYHYIREFITRGDIRLQFVRSEKQAADIFTKALPVSLFQRHRQRLRLTDVDRSGVLKKIQE